MKDRDGLFYFDISCLIQSLLHVLQVLECTSSVQAIWHGQAIAIWNTCTVG